MPGSNRSSVASADSQQDPNNVNVRLSNVSNISDQSDDQSDDQNQSVNSAPVGGGAGGAGNLSVGGGANPAPAAPAGPIPERSEVLMTHLVTRHMAGKNAVADIAEEESSAAEKAAKVLDIASDVVGIPWATISTGSSITETVHRKKNNMGEDDSSSLTNLTGKLDKWNDAAGVISSALSVGSSTASLFANARTAKKSKNKRKKKEAKYGIASNVFGIIGDGAYSSASGIKALGNPGGNAKQDTALKALDAVGAGASFVSGVLDMIGGSKSRSMKSQLRKKAAALKAAAWDENSIADERVRKTTKSAKNKAMDMATAMNKSQKKESMKGIGGLLSSAIGIANSAMGFLGAGFAKNPIWKGISAAAGLVGYVGKYIDKAIDKKTEKNHEKDKIKYAKDKITSNERVNKIKGQAAGINGALSPEERTALNNSTDISNNEAHRIALSRLGIDVTIEDSVVEDSVYEAAFKKMAAKRTRNIINSEPAMKRKMLKAMNLEDGASEQEIYQALCGD